MAKFKKGLQDVTAAETSICKIDGKKGKLYYRGYIIEDLVTYSTFEEVIHLLWYERLPKKSELHKLRKDIIDSMRLPSYLKNINVGRNLMDSLRTNVSKLGEFDTKNNDEHRISTNIMGKMCSLLPALYRIKHGNKIIKPKAKLSIAANFLYMLNGRIPNLEEEKVMDVCLILHAEHGLNASTFSSRVTVATLSDMYSGMVSAIGTLKGPLHGGANVRAINSLHKISKKLKVKDFCDIQCKLEVDNYVHELLNDHIKVMGIGHRVYKVKDPRAKVLEGYAARLGKKYIKYYQIAKEIEKVMAMEKKLYANVDFFSGMVYEDLGISNELYVGLFALSRTAGWIAHMREQYKDNRLIRPSSQYVGQLNKKYVKIGNRG